MRGIVFGLFFIYNIFALGFYIDEQEKKRFDEIEDRLDKVANKMNDNLIDPFDKHKKIKQNKKIDSE